jgi:hypothetical protein
MSNRCVSLARGRARLLSAIVLGLLSAAAALFALARHRHAGCY